MEALEFLKEYKRMCSSYKYCNDCQLVGENCLALGVRNKSDSNFLKITSEVETWSKEHPITTNAQKFEEVFGKIEIKDLITCRLKHDSEYYTEIEILEAKWWNEPYKEHEHERERT